MLAGTEPWPEPCKSDLPSVSHAAIWGLRACLVPEDAIVEDPERSRREPPTAAPAEQGLRVVSLDGARGTFVFLPKNKSAGGRNRRSQAQILSAVEGNRRRRPRWGQGWLWRTSTRPARRARSAHHAFALQKPGAGGLDCPVSLRPAVEFLAEIPVAA